MFQIQKNTGKLGEWTSVSPQSAKAAGSIHLPHHVSQNHPQMPLRDRAAQFAPFAALTGYEAAVGETARLTAERRELDAQEAEELNRRLTDLAARQWMDKLINGEAQNVTDLSQQLSLKTGYVTRILSLNSLAPDIVEAILAGIEPDGLSIAKLTEQPIPEDWNEQRRLYGFPER